MPDLAPLMEGMEAVVGVLPIDPGMTAGNHLLLHVGAVGVQLSDGLAVAISGNTPHRDGLAVEEPA